MNMRFKTSKVELISVSKPSSDRHSEQVAWCSRLSSSRIMAFARVLVEYFTRPDDLLLETFGLCSKRGWSAAQLLPDFVEDPLLVVHVEIVDILIFGVVVFEILSLREIIKF